MSFIRLGEVVRLYYEDGFFDEGRVVSLDPITVDFLDWTESWTDDTVFAIEELFYEGVEVLIPRCRGLLVIDYWQHTDV